jgi:hypothetical protein
MVLSWHWADEANCSVVWGIQTLNSHEKDNEAKKTHLLGDFDANFTALRAY